MIYAMRTLALDFLFDKLGDRNRSPDDLEDWYRDLRANYPERIFPFLVEDVERIEKIYILEKDAEDMLRLVPEDMTREKAFPAYL